MKHKNLILSFAILISVNLNLSAWTSSNEGVCYTMDTLVQLSNDIAYNAIDQMYEVDCNIIILENDTLALNPGEILNFLGHFYIKTYGVLLAIGNENMSIHLGDPNFILGNGSFWFGIQIINLSENKTSILKYCNIKGAIHIDDCVEAAIYCENSSPIIDHCTISEMASDCDTGGGVAIVCYGQSSPIISYCNFKRLYTSMVLWNIPSKHEEFYQPNPLIFGCNIMHTVNGFWEYFCDFDVVIYNGGFLDNCYLGVTAFTSDTTLGFPIDTLGDGICNTTSTFWKKRFKEVDGVVNPRGDTLITGINNDEIDILPTISGFLKLENCYPNPFENYTTIDFKLKKATSIVSLLVFDSKGNKVKTLISNRLYYSGSHNINWHGDNDAGQKVKEGVYFYKLESDKTLLVKKAIVVK